VRESGALLSLCDFHVGLDTGTTHLAAVVGTPCFALFHERDNPGQWFPSGSGHTIIHHPVECASAVVFVNLHYQVMTAAKFLVSRFEKNIELCALDIHFAKVYGFVRKMPLPNFIES